LLENSEESKHGLQLLLDKYFPGMHPSDDSISDDDVKATAVFRIDIESWSGKEYKAEDDFPGAFFYDEQTDRS
ncbi:MAG: hypothetical protein U9Q82_13165, partial [Chloroflexota bacterium]|nr:hypothetical protein [Chloroflexota bacterium]